MSIFTSCFIVQIGLVIWLKHGIAVPGKLIRFGIVKDRVVVTWQSPGHISLGCGALPDDLIPEILKAKDGVQDDLQVMAGGGVAMEVEAAGGFEDAVQLDEAGGHHDEVGEHGVFADDEAKGGEEVIDGARVGLEDVEVGLFGGGAPVPGVIEGGDLGVGASAVLVFEEDVVGAG